MEFDALPLHDATLSAIHVSYEAARCDLRLNVVGGAAFQLVFEGFSALRFPRQEPWGRSCSVNTGRQVSTEVYEIELQSGDALQVEARSWAFRPLEP